MATFRIPVRITNMDDGVFEVPISTQLTLTNAAIGNHTAIVMADGGSDIGVYGTIEVPQNFVGSGTLVIGGALDGAPGAADTLGFGLQGLSRVDNETVDAVFSTEDTASATIGSNGSSHSDEDYYEETIAFSNLTGLAVGEQLFLSVFIDASGTTFTGNFLMTKLMFEYADA